MNAPLDEKRDTKQYTIWSEGKCLKIYSQKYNFIKFSISQINN